MDGTSQRGSGPRVAGWGRVRGGCPGRARRFAVAAGGLAVHDELSALARSLAFPSPEALVRWAELLAIDLKAEADRWLTEDRAKLRSGKSTRWLRERFKAWAEEGYAKLERGERFYYGPA